MTFSSSCFLELQLCCNRDRVVGGAGHAGRAEHDDEVKVGTFGGRVADFEEENVLSTCISLLCCLTTIERDYVGDKAMVTMARSYLSATKIQGAQFFVELNLFKCLPLSNIIT